MVPVTSAALLAYVGLTALLVLAPGMSTALVLRNTAEGGRRAGVITSLGIAIGNSTWGLLAGMGLGVILSGMPNALNTLRIVGAVGLTWLGVRSLMHAWTLKTTKPSNESAPPPAASPSGYTMLAEGVATNLLNPSIPVFYVATVPQFIGPGERFATAFFLLTAVHVVMALTCHCAYAVALGRVAVALAARGRAWTLHALTGAALVALAVFSLRSVI